MTKEDTIVLILAFLMIGVWVAVILNLSSPTVIEDENTDYLNHSPVDINVENNHFTELADEVEEITTNEETKANEESTDSDLIDLSDYDFSELSTADGISIDDILYKIGITVE